MANTLPFRFKAGGNGTMSHTAQPFHHRSTTKTTHKPFKSRHATKGTLKERAKGRLALSLERQRERGVRRTPHQHVMSKLDRRNQAKQRRLNASREHVQDLKFFSGASGCPRTVAIVPLDDSSTSAEVVRELCASVDLEVEGLQLEKGAVKTMITRFKSRVNWLMPRREMWQVLDACRLADYVIFCLSAYAELDDFAESLLRTVTGQGVSNCFTIVQGLNQGQNAHTRTQALAARTKEILRFVPVQEKVFLADNRQDCAALMRGICSTVPSGIRWREERSWMCIEDVRWPDDKKQAADTQEMVVTGVIRGKPLKADRLVQLGNWGDFQIAKITAAPLSTNAKARKNDMTIDSIGFGEVLEEPTADRDDLAELAPEEVIMEDEVDDVAQTARAERKGVLIDDHRYYSDEDEEDYIPKPKKLPRGTSKYQASWFLGDVDYSGSDLETVDGDEDDEDRQSVAPSLVNGPFDPQDATMEGAFTEAGPSEYPASEMFVDPSPEQEMDQIQAYRREREREAHDDRDFPDELELQPNALARERLARYRGLKNLRTSVWDAEEDKAHEPGEWPRLLEVPNYRATRKKVTSEALVGGVKAGTRVSVYLSNVPSSVRMAYDSSSPLAMFSLLRHEHKHTAMNCSITLDSQYPQPMKSKEALVLLCGPRSLVVNPLFSETANTPNDVHKFFRFLHPGDTATATFIAPLLWGNIPALFFTIPSSSDPTATVNGSANSLGDHMHDDDGDTAPSLVTSKMGNSSLQLVGTGTLLPPSTSRIIAKRVILTGHPFKIHKRVVTVRYMFFNAEDVAWFKPLQLRTRRGRRGFIKDSLGTHGYFKAAFDGPLNPLDAVGVSLYKRVWPRTARLWDGDLKST